MVLGDSIFRCNCSITTVFNNHFADVFSRSGGKFTDLSPGVFSDIEFGFEEVNAALNFALLGTGLDYIPGLFICENADNRIFHLYKLFAANVDNCE